MGEFFIAKSLRTDCKRKSIYGQKQKGKIETRVGCNLAHIFFAPQIRCKRLWIMQWQVAYQAAD